MSDLYDRQGNSITMEEWAEMFEAGNSLVRTKVGGDCEVSTVWLGLDHSFYGGPPLIFETLVFGGPLDEHMQRYSTEEQALRGHADICECVRSLQRATHG